MIRSLLRTLPVVALATTLAAVPAAATGSQDSDDARGNSAHARQSTDTRDSDNDGETAHPSGKSRHEEPGGSGTQGKSPSDPDGDTNGGEDKPGGDGGYDEDKDGNNGCGNDNDFEDDNNGNCGGLDKANNDREERDDSEVRQERKDRSEKRTDRTETEDRSTQRDLHCTDHADNLKWEGSTGSNTVDGVTIAWDGDTLTITNANDTDATVIWCAKGGSGFGDDSTNSGVNTDTLAADETVTRSFGTDVSYVVLYDVDTDADTDENVAAGEQDKDEDSDEDSSVENENIEEQITKIIEILEDLDIDVTIRELLETTTIERYLTITNTFVLDSNTTETLRQLTTVLADLVTALGDVDQTETTTETTTATTAEQPATDEAVLSGELTAAPATSEDTNVAAAGTTDSGDDVTAAADSGSTDVAAAAADSDDEVSSSDVLALTGGSIALLALLALLTLGGGSLLVRRTEQQ